VRMGAILTAYSSYVRMRFMTERRRRLLHLNPDRVNDLQKGVVRQTLKRYETQNHANETAAAQSGAGLHMALLFGAGAAIAATVASAGVLAPAIGTLVMLGSEASAIFSGMWAAILGIGQGRLRKNSRYNRIPEHSYGLT